MVALWKRTAGNAVESPTGGASGGASGGAPQSASGGASGTPSGGPVPFHLPARPPEAQQTRADRLDWLCATQGCRYEIERGDGVVRLVLVWPSGDRLSGQGATTDAALVALLQRLGGVRGGAS